MDPNQVMQLLEIANTAPPDKYGRVEICKTTIARAIIVIEYLQEENKKLQRGQIIKETESMSEEALAKLLLDVISRDHSDISCIDKNVIENVAYLMLHQSKKMKKLQKKNKKLKKEIKLLKIKTPESEKTDFVQ